MRLIDDPAQPIAMPPRGAELEVSMGYDGAMVKMGMFVVDEIELSGPPEKMTIRGRTTVQQAIAKMVRLHFNHRKHELGQSIQPYLIQSLKLQKNMV